MRQGRLRQRRRPLRTTPVLLWTAKRSSRHCRAHSVIVGARGPVREAPRSFLPIGLREGRGPRRAGGGRPAPPSRDPHRRGPGRPRTAIGTVIGGRRYTVGIIARSLEPLRGTVMGADRHTAISRWGPSTEARGIPIASDPDPPIERWRSPRSLRGSVKGGHHGPRRHTEGPCDPPITVLVAWEGDREDRRWGP
jgi:hypothetical protein